MEHNSIFQFIFNDNKKYYFLPCTGLTNVNIPLYNMFIHIYAKLYFKILDMFELEYYVFAGTSIGCVRNKSNIQWVDDYDIIIFTDQIEKFENHVVPFFKKTCFFT